MLAGYEFLLNDRIVTHFVMLLYFIAFDFLFIILYSFITGRRKARKVYRHFGPATGVPHSHTK